MERQHIYCILVIAGLFAITMFGLWCIVDFVGMEAILV